MVVVTATFPYLFDANRIGSHNRFYLTFQLWGHPDFVFLIQFENFVGPFIVKNNRQVATMLFQHLFESLEFRSLFLDPGNFDKYPLRCSHLMRLHMLMR